MKPVYFVKHNTIQYDNAPVKRSTCYLISFFFAFSKSDRKGIKILTETNVKKSLVLI